MARATLSKSGKGREIKHIWHLKIFGSGCVSLASMPLVTSLASTVMSALISCSTKLDVSVTFTGLPSLDISLLRI